ncbi:MAG TPA: phosphoribosylformylglycinamidine synthase II, partial [Candidatus Limnocylindria bacterium]|nr:phosphoribosylformylglycinamidine synthase II [Candidatus Limnocylindria bacterium]
MTLGEATDRAPGEGRAQESRDDHGLTPSERRRIVELIGRGPNPVELAMFGAMWSEHCAYKHSRALLGALPTEGPRVLVGPGENAGVVDIGDGLAVVF